MIASNLRLDGWTVLELPYVPLALLAEKLCALFARNAPPVATASGSPAKVCEKAPDDPASYPPVKKLPLMSGQVLMIPSKRKV